MRPSRRFYLGALRTAWPRAARLTQTASIMSIGMMGASQNLEPPPASEIARPQRAPARPPVVLVRAAFRHAAQTGVAVRLHRRDRRTPRRPRARTRMRWPAAAPAGP